MITIIANDDRIALVVLFTPDKITPRFFVPIVVKHFFEAAITVD